MQYTVRHKGCVLGTTELDFYQVSHGQHSGWLHAHAGAADLLAMISIGYPAIRAWLTRRDSLPDGNPLTQPGFERSAQCQAITEAVAARLHLVMTLHREDGSELETRDIVVQDRMYREIPTADDDAAFAAMDEEKRAELEAAIEHDIAVLEKLWDQQPPEESSAPPMDDDEWCRLVEARWREAEESRYQVHVRLANPEDLPSHLIWASEGDA